MTITTAPLVPHFISQITSPHIEEVIVTLLVLQYSDLDCFDWAGTSNVLLHQKFSGLRKVLFNILDSDMDEGAVTAKILEGPLSGFIERGILQVKFLKSP